jgi:hypothetical protein
MREFSKPSGLVQKQQPGSVRRMLFRLLFLFLLLKGFGRFAAFHLAELFLVFGHFNLEIYLEAKPVARG